MNNSKRCLCASCTSHTDRVHPLYFRVPQPQWSWQRTPCHPCHQISRSHLQSRAAATQNHRGRVKPCLLPRTECSLLGTSLRFTSAAFGRPPPEGTERRPERHARCRSTARGCAAPALPPSIYLWCLWWRLKQPLPPLVPLTNTKLTPPPAGKQAVRPHGAPRWLWVSGRVG